MKNPAVTQFPRRADPKNTATPQLSSSYKATVVSDEITLRNEVTGMFFLRCGFVRMIRNGPRLVPVGKPALVAALRQYFWAGEMPRGGQIRMSRIGGRVAVQQKPLLIFCGCVVLPGSANYGHTARTKTAPEGAAVFLNYVLLLSAKDYWVYFNQL